MSLLLIDAGNSRLKWRLVDAGEACREGGVAWSQADWLQSLESEYSPLPVERVLLASVTDEERNNTLAQLCRRLWGVEPKRLHSRAEACGVSNAYETPERLGIDRWLAMLAAYRRCAGALVVIDAGTALTCDLIDASGRHLGGMISPGIDAMGQALGLTAELNWANEFVVRQDPGRNTLECIQAGISQSVAGVIASARQQMADAGVSEFEWLLCGGNAAEISPLIDNASHLEGLVFEGMLMMDDEVGT